MQNSVFLISCSPWFEFISSCSSVIIVPCTSSGIKMAASKYQVSHTYIKNSLGWFHWVLAVINGTGWVWCVSSLQTDTGKRICDLQCLLEIIEGYKDSSKNKRGIFHCCFLAVVEFKCEQSFQAAWDFSGNISASCTTLGNKSHTIYLPGPAPRLIWTAEWSFLQYLQFMCLSYFWQSLSWRSGCEYSLG